MLGTTAALTAFGIGPASAYPPLALGPGSGCAPIGGSTVSCQVYPTGGYGNYSACWNGVCGPFEHLYFSESCIPNGSVTVQVTVHDASGSISATYSSKCLGGPYLP
ncbi:hypothetical protein ACFQ9X_24590 [Catenulispora yoronensis]